MLLAVSRAFGDGHFKLKRPHIVTAEPEVTTTNLALGEDHFFILACDGLWDVFSDDEAVSMVQECFRVDSATKLRVTDVSQTMADRAAQALVTEALDRGSCDNISVVVVRIVPPA